MNKKKEEPTQGIYIDIDKSKAITIVVMFALFFLAPIFGYQYYTSVVNTPTVSETYTTAALQSDESIDFGFDEPRVAGASTSRANFSYTLPVVDITITNDIKNPTNLLILVGLVAVIVSIIVLIGQTFDLFKSGIYR